MAQSLPEDFPIDPLVTSGDELADILNRFKASVDSNNAGGTAPEDTSSGMIWLDTSGGGEGVLRIRNAANNGWITLSTPGGATGLADGTVAAPGLAWSAEPGFGWYRINNSDMGVASNGVKVAQLTAAPAATAQYLYPRAAGPTEARWFNSPASEANFNALAVGIAADGNPYLTGLNGGTASAKQLNITGFSAVASSIMVSAPVMTAGTHRVDTNFYLTLVSAIPTLNFDANDFFQFDRSTNSLSFTRAGVSTQWSPNGDFHGGRDIYSGINSYPALVTSQAGVKRIQLSADGWRLDFNTSTGAFSYVTNANIVLFQSLNNGDFMIPGALLFGGSGDAYLQRSGGYRTLNFASNWMFRWQEVDGTFQFVRNGSIDMYLASVGLDLKIGNGYKPGGGEWAATSDARVKDVLGDYEGGLAQIIALQPRRYKYKNDPTREFVGLVAQEAMQPMPEMVTVREGELGGIELPDMHFLDTSPLKFALINAIKTIDTRLRALEGAT